MQKPLARDRRCLHITPAAIVAEELVFLHVLDPRLEQGDLVLYVPVGHVQIEVAVVVVVEKVRPKAEEAVARIGQPSRGRHILEENPFIAVEGIGLVGKIGDKQVKVAVVVVIPKIHSHAGF